MITNFGDNIKKVILLGIGAMASTAEKSKEIVDDLVRKGEITAQQGKTLNEELKHKIKENVDTIKENVESIKENVSNAIAPEKKEKKEEEINDVISKLDSMSADELAAVKAKLDEIEKGSTESQK